MEPQYTDEDLKDHIGVAAVIKDPQGRILVQDHVKYGFWTIPVGKAQARQDAQEALIQELSEECCIAVVRSRLLVKRDYSYVRKGIAVGLTAYLFEIEEYAGEIRNGEPHKHREQRFMAVEEIASLPYLSDLTLLYLETIGIRRPARLAAPASHA